MSRQDKSLEKKRENPPKGPTPNTSVAPAASSAHSVVVHQDFSGPLPPPALLQQYDQVVKGSADRIILMAETEGNHRRKMEEKYADAGIQDAVKDRMERRIGQILGFLIGTIAIVAGAIVSTKGQPWAGGFIGGSGVIGLVSVFIYGQRGDKAEGEGEDKNHEETRNP